MLLVCTLVLAVAPARSQIAPLADEFLPGSPTESTTESPTEPEPTEPVTIAERLELPGVNGFLTPVGRYINSAPVRLDGRTLFRVAPTDNLTASLRAAEIQERLTNAAQQASDPGALQVYWETDQQGNLPVVYVDSGSEPLFIFTVTELDARLAGASDPAVGADELRRSIREGILSYDEERQPGFLWQQAQIAGFILLVILVLSWILARVQSWLTHRKAQIKQQIADAPSEETYRASLASPDLDDPPSAQTVNALRQKVINQQRLGIVALQRWLCRVGQGILWIGGIYAILGLFPYTRGLQPLIMSSIEIPFTITVILLVTYGLVRFSGMAIDRSVLVLQERAVIPSARSQRLALRFSTFSQVIKGIAGSIIVAIGVLSALSVLGLNLAPLLAGAGIVGLAITLASQGVLSDIINGFLILLEDQYGVGDVIIVGDVAGFVESMNLRITQLRNEEGRLITIPNREITIVQNLSKEWSRVDIMIPVAHTSDLDQALSLVKKTADDMRDESNWKEFILEPPSLLGVDHLDHIGATVRIWIKTLPLKQWEVAREYRRRLKIAFDQSGIHIGVPQQSLQVQSALPIVNMSRSYSGDGQGNHPNHKVPHSES
jgi:small conductance mechanosensitive channel